jgi:hypothetical protein
MEDMVELSFILTALKYLFKSPSSGFDEQLWNATKTSAAPMMIRLFFLIIPPS